MIIKNFFSLFIIILILESLNDNDFVKEFSDVVQSFCVDEAKRATICSLQWFMANLDLLIVTTECVWDSKNIHIKITNDHMICDKRLCFIFNWDTIGGPKIGLWIVRFVRFPDRFLNFQGRLLAPSHRFVGLLVFENFSR